MKRIRSAGAMFGNKIIQKFRNYFQDFPIPDFNGDFKNIFSEMLKRRA
jgi:hypothetical protein